MSGNQQTEKCPDFYQELKDGAGSRQSTAGGGMVATSAANQTSASTGGPAPHRWQKGCPRTTSGISNLSEEGEPERGEKMSS